jgi:hypothetical protein
LNESQLIDQYEKFINLLKNFFDEKNVNQFAEDYGDRLVLCPLGLTLENGGYPGALIERSLKTSQMIKKIIQASNLNIDLVSAIKVALVSELGKLGDAKVDGELYLPQDSDWHKNKLGQYYKYNENCSKINPAHRALFILQRYNLQLTLEELIAVVTAGGVHIPENSFYGNKKNDLMNILQFAKSMVDSLYSNNSHSQLNEEN